MGALFEEGGRVCKASGRPTPAKKEGGTLFHASGGFSRGICVSMPPWMRAAGWDDDIVSGALEPQTSCSREKSHVKLKNGLVAENAEVNRRQKLQKVRRLRFEDCGWDTGESKITRTAATSASKRCTADSDTRPPAAVQNIGATVTPKKSSSKHKLG